MLLVYSLCYRFKFYYSKFRQNIIKLYLAVHRFFYKTNKQKFWCLRALTIIRILNLLYKGNNHFSRKKNHRISRPSEKYHILPVRVGIELYDLAFSSCATHRTSNIVLQIITRSINTGYGPLIMLVLSWCVSFGIPFKPSILQI